MLTTYAQFGSGVEGKGPSRDTFPAEYPVKFNVSYTDGPATTSKWRLTGMLSFAFEKTITGYSFEEQFTTTAYQSTQISVGVSLENPFSFAGKYAIFGSVQAILLSTRNFK